MRTPARAALSLTTATFLLGAAAWLAGPTIARAAPDDPALRAYHAANGLLNRGLYELAAEEYGTFLAAHPDHDRAPIARYGLGVAQHRLGRTRDSVETLAPLLDVDGFEFASEAALLVGQGRLTLGDFAGAASALERIVRSAPEHAAAPDAAGLLTEARYRLGDHEGVVEAAAFFSERWPDHPRLERVLMLRGLAEMSLDRFGDAAQRFERLLDLFPDGALSSQASLLLAQALHRDNAVNRALAQYERVVRAAETRLLPDALSGLGALLRRADRPGDAARAFDRLLREFPDSDRAGDAAMQRARIHFDDVEIPQARALFERAEGLPGVASDRANYWIAKCDLRLDRPDAAADRLQRLLNDHPQSDLRAEIRYDLAVALLRSGKRDEARAGFAEFRAENPAHDMAAEALRLMATIDHERGEHQASLDRCRQFLQEYPDHAGAAQARFLLAENAFFLGDFTTAAAEHRAFLQNHGDHPLAEASHFRLGAALHRLGDDAGAAEHLSVVADGRATDEPYRAALLMLGDIAFRDGQWRQAERLLDDYLAFGLEQPGADDALLKRGVAQAEQERARDAARSFETLIDEFDDSPLLARALFEYGQALESLNRSDDAAAAYARLVELDEASSFAPHALNRLGAIRADAGDADEAARLFQQAAALGDDEQTRAEATLRLARTLLREGRHDEAARAAAERLDPQENTGRFGPALRATLALALARAGRCDEALQAMAAVEGELDQLREPTVDALLYERAWCLAETGSTDDAAAAYRDLLQRDLDESLRAHALVELGQIEQDAQRYADAAAYFEEALALRSAAPSLEAPTTYRLAVCRYELGEHAEAARLFSVFLEDGADPDLLASANLLCGESLMKSNRPRAALDRFRAVVDGHADHPAAETALLRLGEAAAATQAWADSERAFMAFLDRHPDSQFWFQARFGVGWARENQRRYDEAVGAYRAVVDRHEGPTAARAQFQIGECLFAKGEHEQAARELLKVDILYSYPEWSAAALYEAGRCFEAMNKAGEAQAQYQRLVETHPDTEWAAMARARLGGGAASARGADAGE